MVCGGGYSGRLFDRNGSAEAAKRIDHPCHAIFLPAKGSRRLAALTQTEAGIGQLKDDKVFCHHGSARIRMPTASAATFRADLDISSRD